MYRNEDLERFYFKYQPEALPHGQSLQTFCLNNNVPYNLFSKWYKDTRRKIVSVQVDDRPSALIGEESVQSVPSASDESNPVAEPIIPEREMYDKPVRIWLELHVSNGLYVSRKNLSYQELRKLIEKLEVLC